MMVDSIIQVFGYAFTIPAEAKQMLLAGVIGLAIGLERELHHKPASLRTFSTISVGSCLFTILSVKASCGPDAIPDDVSRIAAQIVTGIGFVGGGVIFKTADRVEGITTGSLIWLSAALGMACGFNQIELVLWAAVIGLWVHLVCFVSFAFIYRNSRHAPNGGKPADESTNQHTVA